MILKIKFDMLLMRAMVMRLEAHNAKMHGTGEATKGVNKSH